MFGMGATLTLNDFVRVAKLPQGVMVGLILQFSIMPLVGWGSAKAFGLPNELAAGFILLGSCPGGISSNVVTYLARGDVALSVTTTACSTLAAPIMTPLLFYLFAGETVDVDYLAMFWQIVQTVVAPICLGLGFNLLVRRLGGNVRSCERWLAAISMVAICLICGLIAAKSQERIMQVGGLLLLAISIHNIAGFSLGYWGGRLLGLSERDCRTVAIEVGMQNGGMAANLATEILKKDAAALAPVIFAAVMNVNGSILASHWRSRRHDGGVGHAEGMEVQAMEK